MSETFSFNNTGDREAAGFKQSNPEDSAEKSRRFQGDEGHINPSEIAAGMKRGAARVARSAENLHRRISESDRFQFDARSIDLKAISEKLGQFVDWSTQRNKPENWVDRGKGGDVTYTTPSGETYAVPTFKGDVHETMATVSDLEKARNALALIRVKQRSVFGGMMIDPEQVEETEAIYKEAIRMEIMNFMKDIVNREGRGALKNPENQLRIYKMLCDEKALRAQAETEALATRKGGKVGRWLANHKGLRVGLGIGMMIGGTAATAFGIAPAAAAITFGAGMYTSARGNVERMQGRLDKPKERKRLERELKIIINQNNLSHAGLLDHFVSKVNSRGNKVPNELKSFMQGAKAGVELPVQLQLLLVHAYEAEAKTGGTPAGVEHWMSANRGDIVSDYLSEAMMREIKDEGVQAEKRGKGNRWKIATSVGLGVIGAGAVAGAIGGNMIPAVAGMSGFSIAEYALFKRRQSKS